MSDPSPTDSTLAVGLWLERLKAGDDGARQELLEIAMRRLRLLARKILADIPSVRQFEETDDLLQNSLVRLWKCLAETRPESAVDFFRLAACLIRRELIDLSRHHLGQGMTPVQQLSSDAGRPAAAATPPRNSDDTFDPQRLSQWTEFHEYVERLPDEERSLFDLLWYQGLTVAETSDLLAIPLRTLGRRWKTARVRIYRDLLCDPNDRDAVVSDAN